MPFVGAVTLRPDRSYISPFPFSAFTSLIAVSLLWYVMVISMFLLTLASSAYTASLCTNV